MCESDDDLKAVAEEVKVAEGEEGNEGPRNECCNWC